MSSESPHLLPSVSGARTVFAKVNTPTESHHVETNWCGEGKVPKREPSQPEAGGREDSQALNRWKLP